MQVDCIIPCVGYDDFLDITLPQTKQHFDSVLVVTTDADLYTRKCCRKYSVPCLCTDEWYADGAVFNKGRALNEALGLLKGIDWICSLDADIILPSDFAARIRPLESGPLYSARRKMCYTTEQYNEYLQYDNMSSFRTDGLDYRTGKLVILGYLQLWCLRVRSIRFPTWFPSAKTYDLEFCKNWAPDQRIYIPGMVVLHLGSPGINWNGRVSDQWRI